jgi:hypothetical protein
MDVTIIGPGNMARGVGSRVLQGGHRLMVVGGLNPIDVGGLERARELEALGLLHMTLQGSLGTGYASTVKILA